MTPDQLVDYNVVSYILGEEVMPREKMPPEEYRKRQTAYQVDYNAKNKTRIPLDMNNKYDADILAYLQSVPNKQGLIKQLIRSHMAEAGFVAPVDPDTKEGE